MKNKIEEIISDISKINLENNEQAEKFRLDYASKKGILNQLFDDFKNVPTTDKKETGQILNQLKLCIQAKLQEFNDKHQTISTKITIDESLPAYPLITGTRHPITKTLDLIIEIYNKLGFTAYYNREIEDDWHVFGALNFAEDHPARDMQDTFFINSTHKTLLRTHTSSIQIRLMENNQPPIRGVMPGRVYRNEAISARSHCFFHQIEGLYIDKNVSFKDLKQTLLFFAKEMFGNETKIRLRPSYFPFTEPSAEVDVSCSLCKGKGCNVCKYTGWLEIAGCGMVHPNVLDNCNIDSKIYNGFAFGMGIERMAMLLYQIKDLRLFSENDVRFLEQFKSMEMM